MRNIFSYLRRYFLYEMNMRKFYLLIFTFAFVISARAQVTIGSLDAPAPGAVLELKSSNLGFLPPRVPLVSPSDKKPLPAHVEGMVVYNTTVSDSLTVGLYYNTGSKWVHLTSDAYSPSVWFYMPSVVFDVSNTGFGLTVDLYKEYQKQLNSVNVVGSDNTRPQVLKAIPAATDLYYYVTAYDTAVFKNISIDANGMMTYDVVGQASDSTLINIVFVEK